MQTLRVLVVDDDPMVLQINRAYVEAVAGFRVIGAARNGDEALAAAAEAKPDLILLDVYMPDKDGVAMLRELRARAVPSDVILISAAHDAATVHEALRCGAFDYIIKPFRFQRLQAALESYREAKRKLRAGTHLTQEQLDKVWRGPAAVADGALPKGLNEVTLKQVVDFLSQQEEPQAAVEVAAALGIARVTARRYLDYLEKLGKVQVQMQYGGVGRPLNRYALGK